MLGDLSWGELSLGRVVLGRVIFGASCPSPGTGICLLPIHIINQSNRPPVSSIHINNMAEQVLRNERCFNFLILDKCPLTPSFLNVLIVLISQYTAKSDEVAHPLNLRTQYHDKPFVDIGEVGMTSLQVNCSIAEVNASVFIAVF